MFIIGINGGSGCGKSIVSSYLSQKGLFNIDCDVVARKVVSKGNPCLKELSDHFGKDILNDDETLNRKALANKAFAAKENTELLNSITHKYILSDIRTNISNLRKTDCIGVIIDGAALIESGLYKDCDYNIAVTAPTERRLDFICKRDNITLEEAKLRLSAQKDESYYSSIADYVVINDGTIENLYNKIDEIYNIIYKREVTEMSEKTPGEILKEKLFYEQKNGFDTMSDEEIDIAYSYADKYMKFLDNSGTERACTKYSVALLEKEGFVPFEFGKAYKPGDKIYFNNREKSVIAAYIGKKSLSEGVNIAAAHIDTPRLDIKPTPMYEDNDLCLLKTHYYGGVKKYQWTTTPLALYGIIVKNDGTKIDINIGFDENDPVFCISDLLPHLSRHQMDKTLREAIEGEALNVLIGSRPFKDDKASERVKLNILSILFDKYGVTEKDFTSAELSVLPAMKARDLGFDRSMILAYGHDDKVCAYPCLSAVIDLKETPDKTAISCLTDREEIGSTGNTGLESFYLLHFIEDLCATAGVNPRECLHNSTCISADVNAAFDPTYPSVMDKYNCAHINRGPVITKYTGSGGKSQTSDCHAEFVAKIQDIMDRNEVVWQTGELGKVDEGGGGTVAKFVARFDVNVLDFGVAVISMHAPYEIISKLDLYHMYKAIYWYFKEA